MELTLAFVCSFLSILVSLTAIVRFIYDSKKKTEEDARWHQSIDDKLDDLTRRVDEHNNYAEKFTSCTEDIAFIKGKLEGLK